jgi:hypothetical protein
MHFKFAPKGVCCRQIEFNLTPVKNFADNTVLPHEYCVHHIKFTGGCQGNLSFIAKNLTGYHADYLMRICQGHMCGNRGTSCMNEFGNCIEKAVAIMEEREWTVDDCL